MPANTVNAEIAISSHWRWPVRQIRSSSCGPWLRRPNHALTAIQALAKRHLGVAERRDVFGAAYDRPNAIRRDHAWQAQQQPTTQRSGRHGADQLEVTGVALIVVPKDTRVADRAALDAAPERSKLRDHVMLGHDVARALHQHARQRADRDAEYRRPKAEQHRPGGGEAQHERRHDRKHQRDGAGHETQASERSEQRRRADGLRTVCPNNPLSIQRVSGHGTPGLSYDVFKTNLRSGCSNVNARPRRTSTRPNPDAGLAVGLDRKSVVAAF